jgi:ABC-type Fe3+/spermidine/putrescine transport system ATPase subunit
MAKIELVNLEKKYENTIAIQNINLTIQDQEIVALLGPSGCGKTTTLRCIAGFETLDKGEIKIDGMTIQDLPPEKRNMGMVFQNYALFPHLTVFENVAFGLKIRKNPPADVQKKVRKILTVVGLEQYGHRYPRQLSGGQQQRTAIARALVINPTLLLLDEPLANLDAKLREEMRFYLKSLQREIGVTTIYVTHDQSEALALADKVVIMFNGVVHQIGTPMEIYKRPKTRNVVDFIGLTNFIKGQISQSADDWVQVRTVAGDVVCKKPEWKLAAGNEVLLAVRPENFTIEKPERGAEGVFFQAAISQKAYLGNIIHYYVDTAEGIPFRIEANPAHDYEVGAQIGLSFAGENAWIVSGEEGGNG